MEENGVIEGGRVLNLPPPRSPSIAIAINGNRKSKNIVKWTLEKFVPKGESMFKLLHVRAKITHVPTPMGSLIPLTEAQDAVVTAYREEVEWQTFQKLLPYKMMFAQKRVQVEIVQIESDDVAAAISGEVAKHTINKLVIGASSRSLFSRGQSLSSRITGCTPSFCKVYAVSKGKLSSVRRSDSETNVSINDDSSSVSSCSTTYSSSHTSGSQTDWAGPSSATPYPSLQSSSLLMQRFHALSNINRTLLHPRRNSAETNHFRSFSVDSGEVMDNESLSSSYSNTDGSSQASSFRSLVTDKSWVSDQASTSDTTTNISSKRREDMNFELEKLRIELRHARGMYAIAQTEAIDASRKLSDLDKRRLEESIKFEEINSKEEEAKELAFREKEKYEAAKREAEVAKECAEIEAARRKEAEIRALLEAKEKEKLENALVGAVRQYQKFTWEEIVSATLSFSDNLKIGMGGNGIVYKCSLHHTTAAVKVLRSEEVYANKQFQRELEVLSKIRHPHLLILLGACLDRGCLVYEYMANGSLEERLFRKNNTPPIPWFERYRIAHEVALALCFLHTSKPRPIIHRDLKPANILLDHNFVSKIGDVGLSTMLNSDSSSLSAMYKDTGPVGTLCYMDPEYQRTGVVSPKSDVYAFGLVILQLLTAKPATGLADIVETAIDGDYFAELLDPEAGTWPFEETKELAILGLRCCELRRRDRPDLKDKVLPAIKRLKEAADRVRDTTSTCPSAPPNYFMCPILKKVMDDPCVAADGYTYDRRGIETWLAENDKSPMTNLPLPNKRLTSNYALLSAIMDWKSGEH